MFDIINKIKLINIGDFNIDNGTQQRTIGDLIEYKLNQQIKLLCHHTNYTFNDDVGKKSTGDCIITKDSDTLLIDCKTHNKHSKMSMPNLISMKKLFNLLENNNEQLIYVICKYTRTDNLVHDITVSVINLINLDEQYLGIGNLGNGQLQIKNLNNSDSLNETNNTKSSFNKIMIKKYVNFLDKQIEKYKIKRNIYQSKLDKLV